MTRYARQIAVPVLGAEGQDRLRAAHVLVVGVGGLAAPVLSYLAGAGVGCLRLVDPDRVDLSNLHRQTLFTEADVGHPKVQAAARQIVALNIDCGVEPIQRRLDPGNAAALCAGMDLVLDCADSFAASYTLSDACQRVGLPLVCASVIGLEGYVGAFCGGAPSLRAVFPDLPPRAGTCAEEGVLGPVVGVIGAVQAQMAFAVLAGLHPSPLGQLVTFDARGFRFGGFRFDGAPEPGRSPAFIAPEAIGSADFVVDLRGEDEGPLVRPGALRRPVAAFDSHGCRPEPGQRAVLCCRSGLRAWQAAQRLAEVWDGEIALVALGDPEG
ncbi:HesA/MoeB/ThiF family protein [Rubellimicrobium rubrum]|uniref:HesA/MoeB/ThiF family protein n=1 Tax=Rubellimicrobium rubrum TaxID=2585369 RepID=A0A5C4MZS2_9RHOB|nr:HesA/MoeB/ThiF family protein [Rubellimicrobium rubrum]TNC49425.1 HesA/MoeB/ThiF family protein [Rubellimicrobium rubrum]